MDLRSVAAILAQVAGRWIVGYPPNRIDWPGGLEPFIPSQ
jgi:hypothetical protein